MNTLSWNCQGMGSPWKIQFLQDIVRKEKPTCIFLCETRSKKKKMEGVRLKLGFEGMVVVESQGKSGDLAILWKEAMQAKLVNLSQNHIDLEVSMDNVNPYRITGFYGEPI